MITHIYRVKTMNSIYEIAITDEGLSRCRKLNSTVSTDGFTVDGPWRKVKASDTAYLEKLCIGPSFDVPGVVQTSNVEDYAHFVLSTEPKRKAKALRGSETGIPEFFGMLAEHVKEQVNPQVGRVEQFCGIDGCTVTRVPGLPRHEGSRMCKSGSIASGGTRAHCSCDSCY
jgi:hypothetical protein